MPPRHRRATVARVIPDTELSNQSVANSRLGRWVRRRETVLRYTALVCIAILLIFLALMGKSGNGEPAEAFNPFGSLCLFGSTGAPTSLPYRSGLSSVTPFLGPQGLLIQSFVADPHDKWAGKSVTGEEWFGTGGAYWTDYSPENPDGSGNTCGSIGTEVGNLIASDILALSSAISTLASGAFAWASSPDLLDNFLTAVDRVVVGDQATQAQCMAAALHAGHAQAEANTMCPRGGLESALYLEFLEPVIVLGALWGAWKGLGQKRTIEAAQGALWMLGAATFALVFLAQPSVIARGINSVVGTVTSQAINATTSATSGLLSRNDICYLDPSAPNRGPRQASCAIWRVLVFDPWSVGEFGTASPIPSDIPVQVGDRKINDLRLLQLEATSTNHDEASEPHADVKKADEERWNEVKATVGKTNSWGVWKGDQPSSRMVTAIGAVLAALCVGGLSLVISFSLIVLNLGMLMLILLSPLFLLVGVHPGFGRRIALKWLELLLGTAMKRIVLAVLMAVLMGFYQVVLSTPGLNWFTQTLLIFAVGVGAFIYRKPLTEVFNIISFSGAAGQIGLEGGGEKIKNAGKKAVGVGVGALTGGATAAAGGGGFMAGAKAGGMRGLRSGGGTLRTASSSAAAGRRVAAQAQAQEQARTAANTPRPPQQDPDDPFAYDKAKRDQEKARRLAEQYKDDPEMQRRLRIYFERNPAQEPTQGMTARTVPEPSKADPAMAETLDDIRRGQADTDRKVDEVKRNTDGDPAGRIPRPPNRG